MPRWLCRVSSSEKCRSRCLPRLSTPSSTRPSIADASRPSGRRRPGVRTETRLPARAPSILLAIRRTESPSAITRGCSASEAEEQPDSRDQAPRLAAEARLDQSRLHARADHRLAVHTLDRELLDLAGLGGLGE